jgi:hypothetical protein
MNKNAYRFAFSTLLAPEKTENRQQEGLLQGAIDMKSLKEKSFGLFLFYVHALSYIRWNRIDWISQKFCAKHIKIYVNP